MERNSVTDPFAHQLHWWDDHPAANPDTEPLYAAELARHLTEVA